MRYSPPGGEVDSTLVPVFTDGEVAPVWDRGACAYDTTVGGDYCENDSLNLIHGMSRTLATPILAWL